MQSFEDFEVIVVDDGSTDDTVSLILKWCATDARVRLLQQPNGGSGAARNSGIREARGRYLYLLDGDDLIVQGALERIHATLVEDDYPDVLLFDALVIDELGAPRPVNEYRRMLGRIRRHDPIRVFQASLECRFIVQPCMYVSARQATRALLFEHSALHEDNLYFAELLLCHARSASVIDEALFRRRVRPGSTMTTPMSIRNLQGYESSAAMLVMRSRGLKVAPLARQLMQRFSINQWCRAAELYWEISARDRSLRLVSRLLLLALYISLTDRSLTIPKRLCLRLAAALVLYPFRSGSRDATRVEGQGAESPRET